MKKIILMSVGLSALLLSSPVLAKSNHVSLKVNPITGNQTSVNGKTTKLATIKVLHNKALLGKGIASKKGAFKITLKAPIKNGWKYMIQVTKKGFAAKKYTVTALYASTKTDQAQSNNYQDEIHGLQNTIVSLQSQLNDLKNKQSTTTVVNSDNAQTANTWLAYQKQIDALNNQISSIDSQADKLDDSLGLAKGNILFYKTHTLDGLNASLSEAQNRVKDDNETLAKNNDDPEALARLHMDSNEVNECQTDINNYNQIKSDVTADGGVEAYLNKAQINQNECDKLRAQMDMLNNQIDDLQQKQAAVLNSLP